MAMKWLFHEGFMSSMSRLPVPGPDEKDGRSHFDEGLAMIKTIESLIILRRTAYQLSPKLTPINFAYRSLYHCNVDVAHVHM